MTVLPAAGPDSKPANANELRNDALYFADELVKRLEALHRRQGTNRIWPTAAAIARRIRAVIRAECDRQTRRCLSTGGRPWRLRSRPGSRRTGKRQRSASDTGRR